MSTTPTCCPWQALPHRSVVAADSIAATLARVETQLRAGNVLLLAVTGASNVTGEVLPVAELAALAHRYGARIVVDAAQLAPHRRIDLSASGIDYLAFSGHKLYAPFGSGVLVGRPDWLDAGKPAPGRRRRREGSAAGIDHLERRPRPP